MMTETQQPTDANRQRIWDVIGLDDSIRIKKYLKRPKDLAALVQLEELRRLQRLDEA